MRYCFDIDGTICDTPVTDKGKNDYDNSTPKRFMVETVNRLYDEGHYIILMTARGRGSGMDWSLKTKQQLKDWGLKFHELEPMFHKPNADLFIDDKGVNVEDWRKTLPVTKGIVAGAFDILHPGYIRMFKYARTIVITLQWLFMKIQTQRGIGNSNQSSLWEIVKRFFCH